MKESLRLKSKLYDLLEVDMTFGVPIEEMRVGGYTLSVSSIDSQKVYARKDGEGREVSKSIVDPSLSVMLIPIEPSLIPTKGVIECVHIRVEPPLTIKAEGRISYQTYVPIDYGVVAVEDGGNMTVIDAFSDAEQVPKMSLYGNPVNGHVCRFIRVSQYMEPRASLARLSLIIENMNSVPVQVKNIVIPFSELLIFYKPGTWVAEASPITMRLESETVAEIVRTSDEPPTADFERSIDFSSYVGIIGLRELTKFKMIWGY